MNAVMAGMIPVMVILMSRDMKSMEPTGLRFWGVMSLASIAGFAIAYPVNVWLVAAGLKHGMGTVRVLEEVATPSPPARRSGKGSSEAGRTAVARHAIPEPAAASPNSGREVHGAIMSASEQPVPGDGIPTATGLLPPGATTPQIVAVTVLTLLAMAAGLILAALFGDLMMSNRMSGHGGQGAALAPRSRSSSLSA